MSTDQPIVSVVMPAYNAGVYLRPAVESVLAQTLADFELLIIDDGSTDRSIDDAEDLLTDGRIRLVRQENAGKAAVLNRAVSLARGEFFAIQDADDLSAPTRLERLVARMREEPALAAVFSGYELLMDGVRMAPRYVDKSPEQCRADIDRFRMPSHDPTVMYRLSMIRDIPFDSTIDIAEGWDHILRVGERYPMAVVGEVLYSYRIHRQSITRANVGRRERVAREVLRRAHSRRGVEFRKPEAEPTRRITNRMLDNNLAAHFIESVVDQRRAGRRAGSFAAAIQCAKLHPLDLYYYKPFAYALAPGPIYARMIDRRARRDATRADIALRTSGGEPRADRSSGEWETVACPLCGSSEHHILTTDAYLAGRRWDVVGCACGMTFTNPQPRGETLAALYAGPYYTHLVPHGLKASLKRRLLAEQMRGPGRAARLALEQRLGWPRWTSRFDMERYRLQPGRSFLDFGAGGGAFVRLATLLGCDATGVEPDPEARAAAARLGVTLHPSLDEIDPQRRFDLISAVHVLEHVADPVETLRRLGGRLAPDGRLLILVPNADAYQARLFGWKWAGYDLPRHLWHFTPETLRRTFEAAGLHVVESRTIEHRGLARQTEAAAGPSAYQWSIGLEGERSGLGAEIALVARRAADERRAAG